MNESYLEKSIDELDISKKILDKLRNNNINYIKDVWSSKRKDLKNIKLTDGEINQIIIKLQLHGLDLNKKVY
jgi:DNA-directed RNA polymerase alpha subunit